MAGKRKGQRQGGGIQGDSALARNRQFHLRNDRIPRVIPPRMAESGVSGKDAAGPRPDQFSNPTLIPLVKSDFETRADTLYAAALPLPLPLTRHPASSRPPPKRKNFQKTLASSPNIMYTIKCCGMIAMKREVAALPRDGAGFPWSECQEAGSTRPKNLTASHCTNILSARQSRNTGVKRAIRKGCRKSARKFREGMTRTEECTVTTCRT